MPVSGSGTKNLSFRVYDGTAGTPFYVNFFQLDITTLPLVEPRPPTNYQLDGGKVSANIIPYVTPEDQLVPFQPIPFSAKLFVMSDYLELLDAFSNSRRISPWVIGGDTWTAVTTANLGTRLDVNGNAVAAFAPTDQPTLDGLVNLVANVAVPGDAVAGTALFIEWRGCAVTVNNIVIEGNGLLSFTMDGQIYGSINPKLTAWPAGTESTPS